MGIWIWLRASTAPSAQVLPWIPWATMPLPASMGVMWFPTTINSVMCLWSVVGELMYLPKSRLAVALGMTNTRPADVLTAKPFYFV